MKKIVKLTSAFLIAVILISCVFILPYTVAADIATPGVYNSTHYRIGGADPWYSRDLSGVDWNYTDYFGSNLFTDPTVSSFGDDGTYGTYYDPTDKGSKTIINANAWWDKPASFYNGFYMDVTDSTKRYASAKYNNQVLSDSTLSHTDDGSGVLKIDNTHQWLPLPDMEASSYYALTFWVRSHSVSSEFSVCTGLVMKVTDSNQEALTDAGEFNNALHLGRDNTVEWRRMTALIYTGSTSYTNPMLQVFVGENKATVYFDDFGMYKLDDTYGADCVAAGYVLNTPVEEEPEELLPQVFNSTHYKDDTDTWRSRDLSGVYWEKSEKFGDNLFVDPTVSCFEDGEYGTYYVDATVDKTILNEKAWWDKPAGYSYAKANNLSGNNARYASAKYNGQVLNNTALSHTLDGSGVIKVNDANQYLPLPDMEANSFYALTFWVRSHKASYETTVSGGFVMKICDTNYSELTDGNLALHIGRDNTVEWRRMTALIYTGENTYTDPVLQIWAGDADATVYFDDFGMYKLDAAYGAECTAAGYVLNTALTGYSETSSAKVLNIDGNNTYLKGYENADFSKYGTLLYTDSTVSRFTDSVYNTYYTGSSNYTVIDPLAWWDKPSDRYSAQYSRLETYLSPNDRGFITNDTEKSHTQDGSGAMYIASVYNEETDTNEAPAKVPRISLPAMEKYTYYSVSFWINLSAKQSANIGFAFDTGNNAAQFNTTYIDAGWSRVTFMVYTGGNAYAQPSINLPNLKDVCIDELEVYKLSDDEYAAECFEAGRLLIKGDVDNSCAIDEGDVAALRKELLISENTYEKVSNFNDDERVDIRDLVALAIHLSLES